MPPLETVNAYGVSQRESNIRVWTTHWWLPSASPKGREELHLHKLDQQGKAWITKAQQNWSVNVAMNSQLLDMHGTKVDRLRTQRLVVDP
jgi:hypothetical protein